MKIVLSLCCMTAMLLHPTILKNEIGSSFRTINIHQTEDGYRYFDSLAITSNEDFKAFLEEISQQPYWFKRQEFVDALLKAQIDFNQEALVLLRHDRGSAAVRVSFETPVLEEKTLICEIRGELLGFGPDIVSHYCFALAVSKSVVNKVQLNVVGGSVPGGRTAILLSTTERQPLNIRRDPPPPPKPSPSECPKLILGCPTELLETGKTYEAKLLVEGGNLKDDVNYNWSVTGGEIVGGQGTRSLSIRIKHPNKIVEVWVSLGGINPHCDAVASCSCGPTK